MSEKKPSMPPPDEKSPESFEEQRARVKRTVPELRARIARSRGMLDGGAASRFASAVFTSSGDLSSFLPEPESR